MSRPKPVIRSMTASDTDAAAALLRRGDWGERLAFFDWAVGRPALSPLVADLDGEIVGTGVGSAHGPVGWVGTIFVAPERRRTGLGRALTRAVTESLESRGCRTLLLIATPMGRPVYEREGFRVLDEQIRFSIEGLPLDATDRDPRLRPFEPGDLPEIVALDRRATGEDRSAILADLASPQSTTVAADGDGAPLGFLIRPPWRGGALIAPDPDDAVRLLEARRRSTARNARVGAGLLARNAAGRGRLRAEGWLEERGGVRMIRGEALDWQPEAIYGQLNGALG
jgi:GNAT superfamily N-acetyltransferase